MSRPQPPRTGSARIERILTDGELTVLGRIPAASNTTLVCEVELDGERMRCVYKPVMGEAPLWDFPDGTLAGREVGSYLISEALGWGLIPETVLRPTGPAGVDLGAGMVQRWIDSPGGELSDGGDFDGGDFNEADESGDDPLELVDICLADAVPDGVIPVLDARGPDGRPMVLVHADKPRLQQLAVLDVVINNADRKGGHVIAGHDGDIYGVDHGICLHAEDKLRTVLWGWAGKPVPDGLLTDLRRLHTELRDPAADLVTALRPLITGAEIAAATDRVEELLDEGVLPLPSVLRPIPWPPF